jgi:hypothetical protein
MRINTDQIHQKAMLAGFIAFRSGCHANRYCTAFTILQLNVLTLVSEEYGSAVSRQYQVGRWRVEVVGPELVCTAQFPTV